MKKKIGIIIAILLCVVLLLTFVSCKKKDTSSGLTDVDASVIAEKDAKIKADIDRWLADNASDKAVDLSTKLKSKLTEGSAYYLMTSKKEALKPTVAVTYDKGTETYKVIFTWKNKSGDGSLTKTYTAKAVKVEYDGWAGSFKDGTYDDVEMEDLLSDDDKLSVLDDILDAAFGMVNKTVTDSVSGKFGVEGLLGVEFGDSNYGLEIRGNMDLNPISDAEDAEPNGTEFAVVAKNGDTSKAFGGLYYANGETDEASKIYIGYLNEDEEMEYKYIDYAILNKLFDKIGLKFREGKEAIIQSKTTNTGLNLLFELFGQKSSLAETVGNIASGLIDAYQVTTDEKQTVSVIDINCANLLSTLSSYGSVLNAPMKEMFKDVDYLKYLDLTEMHGLIGHITIVVVADEDGRLTDFELAINIPKCTFYPCADESKYVEVPAISLALYVKDFVLSSDVTLQNVIPDAVEEAEYFSPANFNIEGDVYVKDAETDLDDTFHYHLVTEVNPFKPSMAKASFTIKQSQGNTYDADTATTFFKLTYDQSTKTLATGGTAYEMNDGGEKAYIVKFEKATFNDLLVWLGIDGENWHGFSYNNQYGYYYIANWNELLDSAKAFFDNDLGRYLLEYYISRKTPGDAQTNGNTSAAETELGGGSSQTDSAEKPDLITQIKGYATDVMGIINKIKDSNVTIKDKSFAFNMTAEQINDLVADINKIIKKDLIELANKYIPGAKLPATLTDPSVIDLQVNTDEHKKQLYLSFTYTGDVYEITFDTFVEDQFAVYFKLVKADAHVDNGGTKTFTFDLVMTKDTITAIYKKDGVKETEVTHSNFSIDWGGRNYEDKENGINNLEMYTEEELLAADKIFKADGTGIGTNLVGGLMDLLNSDVVFPVAKILGRVGVRNLAKKI